MMAKLFAIHFLLFLKQTTISYTLNGGTAGASVPESASYDQVINVSNPTKVGYTFANWSISGMDNAVTHYYGSNAAVTSSSNAETLTTKATYFKNLRGADGEVSFVANWTANTYTIAYVLSGGNVGANAPTTGTYDQVVEISHPTRVGYTFTKWTISGMDGVTHYYGETNTVSSNTTNSTLDTTVTFFKNLRS